MQANRILMLLSNAYDPDPRVRQEALSLLGAGWRVRLIAWDRDLKRPARENVEGVEVDRVFVTSTHGRGVTQIFWYVWVYVQMFWRGVRTRFDVVHSHDLDTLPVGWLLGLIKRRPVVYDAHESFAHMLEGSVPPFVQRGLMALESFLMRRTALVVTVGEKLRRDLESRGARHSLVIGNWKRLSEFTRTAEENARMRQALGVPPDALLAVCVTHLRTDRQVEELLDAVDRTPRVYALIGGDGVLAARVAEAAARNPRILYKGFVSGRTIADYTCAADVIYYGFDAANPNARYSAPNKLYEALAAGRPLITGNFGEIADVVRTAACGIVLERYSAETISAALSTLQDAQVRQQMAANALRAGRNSMNWEKGEMVLRDAYAQLTSGSARRPAAVMESTSPPVR